MPENDVRRFIATGKHWDPFGKRQREIDEMTLAQYPKWVKSGTLMDEHGEPRVFIANNEAEEREISGVKPEPAKIASVDISKLNPAQEAVTAPKRGRPRKIVAPLPTNLD